MIKTMKTNRGFAPLVAIIIAVVVVAALGVGYVVLKPKPVPELNIEPPIRNEKSMTSWQLYKNSDIGISFKYPNKNLVAQHENAYSGKKIKICEEKKDGSLFCIMSANTADFKIKDAMYGDLSFSGSEQDNKRLSCTYYALKPCKEFEVDGMRAVEAYEVAEVSYGYVTTKVVRIKNSRSLYAGIEFGVGLASLECNVSRPSTITGCESKKGDNSDVVINYIKKVQAKLDQGDLSNVDKSNLKTLDIILSTIKFE